MKKILAIIRNNYSEIYKGLLFLMTVIILVSIFPSSKQFRFEFYEGRPWLYEELEAPSDFSIKKSSEEIDFEIAKINNSSKYYFSYDEEFTQLELSDLSSRFDTVWLHYFGFGDRSSYSHNKEICLNLGSEILETGFIDIPNELESQKEDKLIYVVKNKIAKEAFLNFFYTSKTASLFIKEELQKAEKVESDFISSFLNDVLKPNVIYDSGKTEAEKNISLEQISPNRGIILKGQHIISKGEIVDSKTFKILESLRIDFESQTRKTSFGLYIGKIILVSIPLFSFGLFLLFFMGEILEDTKNLIMIFLLIISMMVFTRLIVVYDSNLVMVLPLMISPIIIRAFFDARLALIVHLTTVILLSFVVPDSSRFVFLQLMTGLITITSIVKLQKRSQFFFTALYIFASYSLMYIGIELITESNVNLIDWNTFLYFGISASLTLLASPIIYLFERIFGKVTDVSLLEYADTNNSLIRQLSTQAPGTFNHCIQVSNLAEAAAVEIGANELLVRAGAMYHDIGKMENPMYFTENQSGGYSPHEELSYEESANIIIGHILAGVKKAREHNLPSQIIDFIRTHHGTKRVEYFYRMHKIDLPDEEVKLNKFTYHGPIPYSKETCILMMADAVEAASRSIKKPDAKSISELVDSIIKSQLDQGQFNNANISMREINSVKKTFKKKLLHIYHLRIEYPDEK